MPLNATYSPACQEPKAYGQIDIKIAAPAYTFSGDTDTTGTKNGLISLGVATDSIEVSSQPFFHDIYSDRNGGTQGAPVEMQYLGHMVNISMALTSWNPAAINLLYRNAINAQAGKITQFEVGSMMFRANSIRLLLNTIDSDDIRNFWCCMVREPQAIGMGTKWAEYRLSFTAYRPPCYHPKADILEDQDNT